MQQIPHDRVIKAWSPPCCGDHHTIGRGHQSVVPHAVEETIKVAQTLSKMLGDDEAAKKRICSGKLLVQNAAGLRKPVAYSTRQTPDQIHYV